jgi:hypothetical protein
MKKYFEFRARAGEQLIRAPLFAVAQCVSDEGVVVFGRGW